MFEFDSQIWVDYFLPILTIWLFYILRLEYEVIRKKFGQSYTSFLLTKPGTIAAIVCELSFGVVAVLVIANLVYQFWSMVPLAASTIWGIIFFVLAYMIAFRAAVVISGLVHDLASLGWAALYHPRSFMDF